MAEMTATRIELGPRPDLPDTDREMSNFDHSIDDGLAEDLRAGKMSTHNAWDFNGRIWYDPKLGQFVECVFRYHEPVAAYAADSLRDLMEAVNDEHGWD